MSIEELGSLSDIESMATDLAQQLLEAGKQEALLIGLRLEGLRDLAQIIQVGDGRIARTAELEVKQQALEAMGSSKPTTGVPPCPSRLQLSKDEYYVCVLGYQHAGPHTGGGTSWTGPGNAGKLDAVKPDPTKPAADRLHELLSYLIEKRDEDAVLAREGGTPVIRDQAASRRYAYGEVATKLESILMEGGI